MEPNTIFLAYPKDLYTQDLQLVLMSMDQRLNYLSQESNFILRIESYHLNFKEFSFLFGWVLLLHLIGMSNHTKVIYILKKYFHH